MLNPARAAQLITRSIESTEEEIEGLLCDLLGRKLKRALEGEEPGNSLPEPGGESIASGPKLTKEAVSGRRPGSSREIFSSNHYPESRLKGTGRKGRSITTVTMPFSESLKDHGKRGPTRPPITRNSPSLGLNSCAANRGQEGRRTKGKESREIPFNVVMPRPFLAPGKFGK